MMIAAALHWLLTTAGAPLPTLLPEPPAAAGPAPAATARARAARPAHPSFTDQPRQILEGYSTSLRHDFHDYDQWTLDDLSRLDDLDVQIVRLQAVYDSLDWSSIIPQAIRTRYGNQASRVFVAALYDRMRALGTFDSHMNGVLAAQIGLRLHLGRAQVQALNLGGLHDIRLRDRATGQIVGTIRATIAEALYHQINRDIMEPTPLPPGQYHNPYQLGMAIPDSVLDAIIDANPQWRAGLEALRGVRVFHFAAGDAYDAGQVAQSRGRDNIRDWSMHVDDLGLCDAIAGIEADLFNRVPNDVIMQDAWRSGNARGSHACPAATDRIGE
jgi:hypothetical protein